jgi:hypothetical protein
MKRDFIYGGANAAKYKEKRVVLRKGVYIIRKAREKKEAS